MASNSISALLLDVLCTLGYLQIKLHDLKNLVETVQYLRIWIDLKLAADSPPGVGYPEGAEGHCRYLLIVSNMLLLDPAKRAHGLWVAQMMQIYSEPEFHGHACAMHDLAILEKVSEKDDPACYHLPIDQCGAYKLPVLPINTHLNDDVPKKPDYIVGLKNFDTLRRPSDGTKAQINVVQRAYRQPLTKWE